MNKGRVGAMVAYALTIASEADEYRDRELGPIHLLKFLYLGDLAFAEKNGGTSYSEIPWMFYKFGPWSAEAYEHLPAAAELAGAEERHFRSEYREDAIRWRLPHAMDPDDLVSKLPPVVSRAIRESVKTFHNHTYSLLHHVYRTAPMLSAAPGEPLVFRTKEETANVAAEVEHETLPHISKTQLKKIKERVRSRLAERRMQGNMVSPEVSYDSDFFEILDLLEEDAGRPVEGSSGVLEFSDEVWKSEARRGSGIP